MQTPPPPSGLSLPTWVLAHADKTPTSPCLGVPGVWLSYAEVAKRIQALAADLAQHGVGPGDFVLVALPNMLATPIASMAIQYLGACSVELNREWGALALREVARQTQAKHAIVLGKDARLWGQLAHAWQNLWVVHPSAPHKPMHEALCFSSPTWLSEEGKLAHMPATQLPLFSPSPQSPALLVYTSGSTGEPRGVIQTFQNIFANTESICQYLELGSAARILSILPLYYCYGKSLLQTHMRVGGSIFFDNRFLYPRLVIQALGEENCTGFAGVPLTFELLQRQVGDLKNLLSPSLRYVTQAGGAMRPATIEWVRHNFAPARLYVMYGQTEATARLSFLPPECAQAKAGSIGRGIPGVELQVVDDEGKRCAPGTEGELVARGENISPGYFKDEEATREMLKNGWLHTGDLGHADSEGFIFICGRAKEFLKLSGHRVSPAEIENVLLAHPNVAEAAVVGVPDALEGECAVACVVLKAPLQTSSEELRKFCYECLPAFKIPKCIVEYEALPKNGAGKLDKPLLKQKLERKPCS
ncbi:MAG: acyl--CoA ligase [Cystobacterineae bacterium]|nr:acyl--CoA ligase [Cystobacterineae bacterium]